jgi:hypothetical protein
MPRLASPRPTRFEVGRPKNVPDYAKAFHDYCIGELQRNPACALFTSDGKLWVLFDSDVATQKRLGQIMDSQHGIQQLTPKEALQIVGDEIKSALP